MKNIEELDIDLKNNWTERTQYGKNDIQRRIPRTNKRFRYI